MRSHVRGVSLQLRDLQSGQSRCPLRSESGSLALLSAFVTGRRAGSMTVVVERAGRRGAFDARDSTQIFVDRLQVMVGHILKRRPRHDLEKITIEGRREA